MAVNEKLLKGGVEIQDGAYLLRVSRDRLQAVVTLKDIKEAVQLDFAKLKNDLKENGIEFGVLPEPEAGGSSSFLVAKGKAPVPGENSKVKLHVKPSVVHVPKRKNPDKDEVDFRELGNIVNVAKDTLLVEKIAPTLGKAGMDVFGVGLPAKPGKDRNLKSGKGVRLSEDSMKIYADLDGKFVMAEGKPSVFGEHAVSGDVDMSVGNIVFGGSKLIIAGEVLSGFSVKCRGDIVIQQGVNNAFVMAGGDLYVASGTVGEDAVLRAKGNVTVDFVENGPHIETAGKLIVNDFLVQIDAKVGKDVIATKGKGTIIGGKFIVAGSIHVVDLGSDAEIMTDISVGMIPSLQAKKIKLDEEFVTWSDRLNEVLKNISALDKMKKDMGAGFPEDKAVLLKKCQGFMPKAMDKVNDLTEANNQLAEELGQMINERIYVYGTLFPGVVVKIGSLARTITLEEQEVVVFFDKEVHQILVRKMTREERAARPEI
ncbi:MAG TPA: DUF342 domain-containing protein [Deltaproteobacteria bacterium]|nr:DUF342 domain-containing protein [Deltaproteobacteria bacterium]